MVRDWTNQNSIASRSHADGWHLNQDGHLPIYYSGTDSTFDNGLNHFEGHITDLPSNMTSIIGQHQPANSNAYSYTTASLEYSFLITAPSVAAANAFALSHPAVSISGSATLQQNGNGGAQIGLSDLIPIGSLSSPAAITEQLLNLFNCCGTTNFSTPVTYFRLNQTQFGGTLQMFAHSYSYGLGGASGTLDPTISIDSTYLAQNPGFVVDNLVTGPVSITEPDPIQGVPEPATWAMLILGVAMIGIAARRRYAGVALSA